VRFKAHTLDFHRIVCTALTFKFLEEVYCVHGMDKSADTGASPSRLHEWVSMRSPVMHISSSLSDTIIDDSVKPFQTPLGSNITNLRVPQVNGNTATAVYLGRKMRTCRDGKGRWILGFHVPT
jgi:hypothetical protein